MTDDYATFLKKLEEIKDIDDLKRELIALKRANFGLQQKVKNLERKLYKRNETYMGSIEPNKRKLKY